MFYNYSTFILELPITVLLRMLCKEIRLFHWICYTKICIYCVLTVSQFFLNYYFRVGHAAIKVWNRCYTFFFFFFSIVYNNKNDIVLTSSLLPSVAAWEPLSTAYYRSQLSGLCNHKLGDKPTVGILPQHCTPTKTQRKSPDRRS